MYNLFYLEISIKVIETERMSQVQTKLREV